MDVLNWEYIRICEYLIYVRKRPKEKNIIWWNQEEKYKNIKSPEVWKNREREREREKKSEWMK